MKKYAIIGMSVEIASVALALRRQLPDADIIVLDEVPKGLVRPTISITPPIDIKSIEIPTLKAYEPHVTKTQLNKPHKHLYAETKGIWICTCGRRL